MGISVRRAGSADIDAIVGVHCSFIDKWYRDPQLRQGPATYEELSPFQRGLHGGSWMDSTLLQGHMEDYFAHGDLLVVAERNGRVVGQADIRFEDEPPPFGKYVDIEMLIAHRDAQNQGVEEAVVKWTKELAKEGGYPSVDSCTVSLECVGDEVERFGQLGFQIFRDQKMVTRDIGSVRKAEVPLPSVSGERTLSEADFVSIRQLLLSTHVEPSRMTWYKMFEGFAKSFRGERPPDLTEAKEIGFRRGAKLIRAVILIACSQWLQGQAELHVWVEPEYDRPDILSSLLGLAAERAMGLGAPFIRTTVPVGWVPWLELGKEILGDIPTPWVRLKP